MIASSLQSCYLELKLENTKKSSTICNQQILFTISYVNIKIYINKIKKNS